MGLALTITILFGAGLFGLWPACYVADKALKSKKICFYCGPLVILYLLALIIVFVLYIVYVGFSQVTPSQWAYFAIEIPLYLLFSIFVISGFREFLKKPESKEETKEETPIIDVLDAEKPKEEKNEETEKEEGIKIDNGKEKKDIPSYVFEFSSCAEDDQFLIRLKFTKQIPLNEDPSIYYRRTTDIIAATILKDAILNYYRVKIEDRNDYNPQVPLFPPFYKFRLSKITRDEFEVLKINLLCKEFIEEKFFQVVSNKQSISGFHDYPIIAYTDEGFTIDGYFFKDDKSINKIGYDLTSVTRTMMFLINFFFSFNFYFYREDKLYDSCHYLYLKMDFKSKDVLMADVVALALENITLDELKSHYYLYLNHPLKEIRQVRHPYKILDFTEIPVCIPYATNVNEREVIKEGKIINNGFCNFVEIRLEKEFGAKLVHLSPYHCFKDGVWYLFYNIYVSPVDDDKARMIQDDFESWSEKDALTFDEACFPNNVLDNLERAGFIKKGFLFYPSMKRVNFLLARINGAITAEYLGHRNKRKIKRKNFMIQNEIEGGSDPFSLKIKDDMKDESADFIWARIKINGNPFSGLNEIYFLNSKDFNLAINKEDDSDVIEPVIEALFYFKGEKDKFMSFVEALNLLGTQVDKVIIIPLKSKTIIPIMRVKYFQKLLDNHDYANPNEKLLIQNCLDLAKRRNEEMKKSPNRLFIRGDFK